MEESCQGGLRVLHEIGKWDYEQDGHRLRVSYLKGVTDEQMAPRLQGSRFERIRPVR